MAFKIERPQKKSSAQLAGELAELERAERGIKFKTPWIIKKAVAPISERKAVRKGVERQLYARKIAIKKLKKERKYVEPSKAEKELALFKEKQKILTEEKKERIKAEYEAKKEARQKTLKPYITYEQEGEVI